MNKRVLVVTPRFPYPEAGACEQDRAESIRQLQHLGFEVHLIGKVFDWQDKQAITGYWQSHGVPVRLVGYRYHRLAGKERWRKIISSFLLPWYLDGAAYEYRDPDMRALLKDELKNFRPDLVWFDYTYLWPLYHLVRRHRVPIIVRSINFEANHFLDEDGRTIINYLKAVPKFITEWITARAADVIFSINPQEYRLYQRYGARQVYNLPLRALQHKLHTHEPSETSQLRVFFSGSTYNVAHNRLALEFILKELAPAMHKKFGDRFVFHITGAKFPEHLQIYIRDNVRYEGFVDEMDAFLQRMDIAVVPSFFGAGMQQKIFEPLARGFPTITHTRGLAGYDFVPGQEVLVANDLESFCQALESLRSLARRQELSANAKHKSQQLFSQNILDRTVRVGIESALK